MCPDEQLETTVQGKMIAEKESRCKAFPTSEINRCGLFPASIYALGSLVFEITVSV
jgi:hypothetical protein